jgi:hypothetical protein
MISPAALEKTGTTNKALREIFTAKPAAVDATEEDKKLCEARCKLRKTFEDRINNRLMEHINFSLKNYQFYSAVDLAWEPPPLSNKIYPLVLYGQNRIDTATCANQLRDLKCADEFVKKDEKGNITGIDLPRFFDVSINLVRSMVTRRLAAQSNKYNNLFPYFKYESRSTSQVGKLRADIMSQRADIMADQFDYRHTDVQAYRDGLMYGHTVDFVRCAWERDMHWAEKKKAPEDKSKPEFEAVVTREGLAWVKPHPSRVFCDNAYTLASLNSDSGCEYIGFWDVARFGSIHNNPLYFNRTEVGYNQVYLSLFQTYAQYFSQYYTTITPPAVPATFLDVTAGNDRKNLIGYYSGEQNDTSVVIANYYEKLIPSEWGFGSYPYPVWVRFVVAGWDTIIYAEILPSTPGAVLSYNEKDDRQLNLGVGHELLAWQDHMTNLVSYLLLALTGDNQKILVLDIDVLSPEQRTEFRKRAHGKKWRSEITVLEISRAKLEELHLKVGDIISLIETKSSTQITLVMEAMLRLMSLMERVMALSPQEQGQPAPREISATETNLIAGTTESVYNFISDALDEFRAAKKKIIYESYMFHGEQNFRVPVIARYSKEVIAKAGLQIEDMDEEEATQAFGRYTGTIIGAKGRLEHEFIFTSRDGAERASNTQAAATLGELLKSILPIPAVQESLTKNQLAGIINELSRLSGAYDLKLPDDDPKGNQPMSPSAGEQVQQAMQQMASTLEEHSKAIQQIEGVLQHLTATLEQQSQQISTIIQIASGGRNGMPNGMPPGVPQPAGMGR